MRRNERTRTVVDETTVYEIDLDCLECREREEMYGTDAPREYVRKEDAPGRFARTGRK